MPKVLPENIKNDILSTTRKLMVEQGYNKISIRDITQTCGIATGTFYNYYNSKQEVISALLYDDWNRMQLSLKERRSSTDLTVMEQLEFIFDSLKTMMKNVHELWALGFPEDYSSEGMQKMAEVKKQLHNEMSQSIQHIIHNHIEPEKEKFMADFFTNVFFTYGYDRSTTFDDIRFVINKFIV